MLGWSQAARYFESRKRDLLEAHAGRFALVHGTRILGLFDTVDEAFAEAARRFDLTDLSPGQTVLISQIAEPTVVRIEVSPRSRR